MYLVKYTINIHVYDLVIKKILLLKTIIVIFSRVVYFVIL